MVQEQGRLFHQGTPDGSHDGYADVRLGPLGRRGRGPEEEYLCTGGAECGLILLFCMAERLGCSLAFWDSGWQFEGKVLMIFIYTNLYCDIFSER